MSNQRDDDHDSVFHERPHLLAKKGYRGFSISNREQHWEGVKITASKRGRKSISATGSTEHEALKKIIDQIDMLLDG
jgi:hypothetical protein